MDHESLGISVDGGASYWLLGGCGSYQTLEELEKQAFLTGDWSAVERRERIIQRRKARSGNICPAGSVAVCEAFAGSSRCSCVESDNVHAILAGRY